MPLPHSVQPARGWTDDDGEILGDWLVIGLHAWRAEVAQAGGLEALSVFSSLTDPDGVYGRPEIYTAWGKPDDDVPLVDARHYKDGEPGTTLRKFIRRAV